MQYGGDSREAVRAKARKAAKPHAVRRKAPQGRVCGGMSVANGDAFNPAQYPRGAQITRPGNLGNPGILPPREGIVQPKASVFVVGIA